MDGDSSLLGGAHTAQGRGRMSHPIKAVRDASSVILSLKVDFLNPFQMNENHPGLAREGGERAIKTLCWPI